MEFEFLGTYFCLPGIPPFEEERLLIEADRPPFVGKWTTNGESPRSEKLIDGDKLGLGRSTEWLESARLFLAYKGCLMSETGSVNV